MLSLRDQNTFRAEGGGEKKSIAKHPQLRQRTREMFLVIGFLNKLRVSYVLMR